MDIVDTSFHGHHTESFHSVDQVSIIIFTIVTMMVYIHLFLLIGTLYVALINHILSTSQGKKRYLI